jgi:hypothetical protein
MCLILNTLPHSTRFANADLRYCGEHCDLSFLVLVLRHLSIKSHHLDDASLRGAPRLRASNSGRRLRVLQNCESW